MTTSWQSQVTEDTACEAAAYGRQARRENRSIDSRGDYGDGHCHERYFRDAWRREDRYIRTRDEMSGRFDMLRGRAAV